MFSKIFGHSFIKTYLQKALIENHLPQTLLFKGPEGVGKKRVALELVEHLLGTKKTTDLHILSPEGKSGLHSIDSIRQMIEKDHSPPFESLGKVFIIEDAERMLPSSANALLKTLEEPSLDSTFILLTSKSQEMLPTILSRASVLTFHPLKQKELELFLHDRGLPIAFAKFAQGSIGQAFEMATDPLLEKCRNILFQILSQKPSYPDLMLEIGHLEKLTEKIKEEEPVKYHRLIDHLFSSILMWVRDSILRNLDANSSLLFFPDETASSKKPIEPIEKSIEKARRAFSLNIKLSTCFSFLLSELTRPVELCS